MRYTHLDIEKIWSKENRSFLMQKLWLDVAKWQSHNGFERAISKEKVGEVPMSTSHEVVDELNKLIKETGLVNLHAGLTSSDIVDNVRLIQIKESAQLISSLLGDFYVLLKTKEAKGEWRVPCVGYTHFQYASRTDMTNRLKMWRSPLFDVLLPPRVFQKQMAGAVGTKEAMNILGLNPDFDFEIDSLDGMRNMWLQSSDFTSELNVAHWLSVVAAQLHKIAFDVRFLMHTGELVLVKDQNYRGSSAMATKVNPIEFERVCSLCRLVPKCADSVWDAMAHNGIERTLDNSASLKVVFPEMFNLLAVCITLMNDTFANLCVNVKRCKSILKENEQAATVELRLAQAIKNGDSRLVAFEKLKNNEKTK